MVICIECRYPVKNLYTTYSKADDRTLGKGVRLTQCPRCKRFADKYVEHDFIIIFIDLVLIKPQVYRHLLFNRLGTEDEQLHPSIKRLAFLLLLFDVYLTWARLEKASPNPFSSPSTNSTASTNELEGTWLSTQPLVFQYLFFLALVSLETLAFHLPIRLLCSYAPSFGTIQVPAWTAQVPVLRYMLRREYEKEPDADKNKSSVGGKSANTSRPTTSSGQSPTKTSSPLSPAIPNSQVKHTLTVSPVPQYPHPTPLSTALLVSSCTKLFPILLIIWEYDLPSAATAVSWAVIVNNIAALEILMDCGYLSAGLLVAIGASCRAAVGWGVLGSVGLGNEGRGLRGGLGIWENVVRGGWGGKGAT